jgi:hypothetical protein
MAKLAVGKISAPSTREGFRHFTDDLGISTG